MDNSDLDKIATLANKFELKPEQDKTIKLQALSVGIKLSPW